MEQLHHVTRQGHWFASSLHFLVPVTQQAAQKLMFSTFGKVRLVTQLLEIKTEINTEWKSDASFVGSSITSAPLIEKEGNHFSSLILEKTCIIGPRSKEIVYQQDQPAVPVCWTEHRDEGEESNQSKVSGSFKFIVYDKLSKL